MKRIIAGTLATLLLITGTIIGQQDAAPRTVVAAESRGTFRAPIYDPPITIPVGGLAMIDIPGVPADKLDVAIIGGSYAWDGKQVVFTPKQPRPRLLFDGLTKEPLLLVPTNEEFRGNYHILLVGGEALRIIPLTIGTGVAPTPIPPGPTPIPPGPTPPPVVEGKRALLIIRESADVTPAVGAMITALRNPPHADYLKTKGHTLSILDDDSVDQDGKPAAIVEAWRPHFSGMTLPVLFVIDPNGNKLVHKESLPATAKADDVMKILKANGG